METAHQGATRGHNVSARGGPFISIGSDVQQVLELELRLIERRASLTERRLR
jgi:hypothetical protein